MSLFHTKLLLKRSEECELNMLTLQLVANARLVCGRWLAVLLRLPDLGYLFCRKITHLTGSSSAVISICWAVSDKWA
jgi:hypothetical protein